MSADWASVTRRVSSTAALPTPEPEKRVLPLDIFPASLVESLFTVKSYTADLPGDFAGGLVDIQTKDIPDQPFFTLSTGVGYNRNLGDTHPSNSRFETLWITHYPDAYRGLMRMLREFGGRDVRILALRFEKPHQDFVNVVLHETSRVDAEIDGVREDDLRLFGSVVRVGDQWKVLSYPDG